jgi:hypothetical protein
MKQVSKLCALQKVISRCCSDTKKRNLHITTKSYYLVLFKLCLQSDFETLCSSSLGPVSIIVPVCTSVLGLLYENTLLLMHLVMQQGYANQALLGCLLPVCLLVRCLIIFQSVGRRWWPPYTCSSIRRLSLSGNCAKILRIAFPSPYLRNKHYIALNVCCCTTLVGHFSQRVNVWMTIVLCRSIVRKL